MREESRKRQMWDVLHVGKSEKSLPFGRGEASPPWAAAEQGRPARPGVHTAGPASRPRGQPPPLLPTVWFWDAVCGRTMFILVGVT